MLVLSLDPDPASRQASVVEMRTLRSGDTGVTAVAVPEPHYLDALTEAVEEYSQAVAYCREWMCAPLFETPTRPSNPDRCADNASFWAREAIRCERNVRREAAKFLGMGEPVFKK